jgi:hypothetical protein
MSETSKLLNVVLVSPEDGESSVLGQISVGPNFELALITAPEVCNEFLATLVEQLNAKDVIAVKVPGQARYAVASHEYSRTSPEFFEGLQLYLKHYYAIDLLSATDFADKPDEFEPLGI